MSNNFLDKDGNVITFDFNTTLGRKGAAASRSFALSNEDLAAISAISTALAGTLTVTSNVGTGTRAISASSLPLPTGAATAANQTALTALFPTSLGTKTAANSLAVTLASDGTFVTSIGAPSDAAWTTGNGTQIALLKAIAGAAVDTTTASPVTDKNVGANEPVAASQTDQVMGSTGATGDFLAFIVIQPTSTTVGSVTVKDNATVIYTYPGGTVGADLRPFPVPIESTSKSGAWKISTGAGVTVLPVGRFT